MILFFSCFDFGQVIEVPKKKKKKRERERRGKNKKCRRWESGRSQSPMSAPDGIVGEREAGDGSIRKYHGVDGGKGR